MNQSPQNKPIDKLTYVRVLSRNSILIPSGSCKIIERSTMPQNHQYHALIERISVEEGALPNGIIIANSLSQRGMEERWYKWPILESKTYI